MQSLYILLPIALFFCAIAIAAWFWAVNNGQYDDLDKEGRSILFDEDLNDSKDTDVTNSVSKNINVKDKGSKNS